ncbi:hypothetical protein FACS1894113_5550 [Alphaproteobacteria bacterium]|nr:hypothetical protein FACS1894113_5550 [Alphaproteobacteria bacterium]
MFFNENKVFGAMNNPPQIIEKKLAIPVETSSMLVCNRLSPVIEEETFVQKHVSAAITMAIANA